MVKRAEFLIAATRSGSGKTLLTIGILAALSKRGLDVQPFKCGPDFIDPSLHQTVVDRPSINLDLHMMGEEGCSTSHANYAIAAEAVVVEGVMGLFDGGNSSSAALAELLDMPVVLIVDVRSAAESVAAVIKGFEIYNPDLRICGVILNRVGSDRHRMLIEDAVRASCTTEILGFFPRNSDFEIPSRHLGLHMGHEIDNSRDQTNILVDAIETHIDIERLLELSQKKVAPEHNHTPSISAKKPGVRIAIASDEAFCFYYQENFDLLKMAGFELVEFSPLDDAGLPENISGIYLGGGYPELYAEQLSANVSMREEIAAWAADDNFLYGECGGFMYMTSELIDSDGRTHPMSGVFEVKVQMKSRLSRLGYRRAILIKDSYLGEAGDTLYGHEFHYSDIIERSDSLEYLYQLEGGKLEGCLRKNAYGSYVHIHFSRSEKLLRQLYRLLNNTRQV